MKKQKRERKQVVRELSINELDVVSGGDGGSRATQVIILEPAPPVQVIILGS